MAAELVTALLTQLATLIGQEAAQEVKLVVGAEEQVEKITSNLQAIQDVLEDAEKKQVKQADVRDWLYKLKQASYDIDDVLDERNTAILKLKIEKEAILAQVSSVLAKKVCSFISSPCFYFSWTVHRHDIAFKIGDLNEKLEMISKEKEKYRLNSTRGSEETERLITTSFVDVSEVFGRDRDENALVSELLEDCEPKNGLHIITIVGMGGVGKTTLAQLAYNDNEIMAYFNKAIWVCVSDPFDEIRIAKAIIESLTGARPNAAELQTLLQCVQKCIQGKKFLLVLDDVWTEDYKKWEQLKNVLKYGAPESKILVTTRKEQVAHMLGTTKLIPLELLSEQNCWSLFSRVAFFGRGKDDRKELEDIGREIVKRCKGLPLAAKSLGSLLRFKKTREQWQSVLASDIWELEGFEEAVFVPLLLSYYDLPPAMKRCFSYCAVFPKGHMIDKQDLIEMWMAQGYLNSRQGNVDMEITGDQYFDNLAMRSFFQEFEKNVYGSIKSCKMHDIVHRLALYLMKNECFNGEINSRVGEINSRAGEINSRADSSSKNFRHLFSSFIEIPISFYRENKLRTLLSMPRSQASKIACPKLLQHLNYLRVLDLRDGNVHSIPREMRKFIHLRYLNLSRNSELDLSEILCDLCNLQTLKVEQCDQIKLPQGIGMLVNLRHLHRRYSYIPDMPKGIGKLTTLRTLDEFKVTKGDYTNGCKLGDLKDLNHLRGELSITGLECVSNLYEAEVACLKHKKHLRSLTLHFDVLDDDGGRTFQKHLLNALEPHQDLEHLRIFSYSGTGLFPNWILSLTKLKLLSLNDCVSLEQFPPVGKLPNLESLEISYAWSIKKVGIEFLGLEESEGGQKQKNECENSKSSLVLFPKLKSLSFSEIKNWEEWKGLPTEGEIAVMPSLRSLTISSCDELWKGLPTEGEIAVMPSLRSLTISSCDELKALPEFLHVAPLQELSINHCSNLRQRYQVGTGEDWPKISHIPYVSII